VEKRTQAKKLPRPCHSRRRSPPNPRPGEDEESVIMWGGRGKGGKKTHGRKRSCDPPDGGWTRRPSDAVGLHEGLGEGRVPQKDRA